MGKFIDLTGQRFGRLVVVNRIENNKYGQTRWHCKCDCCNECDVDGHSLRNGMTKSCGCLHSERVSESNSKNFSKTNEFTCFNDSIIVKTSTGIEFLIDKDDEWVLKNFCWHIDGNGYVCTTCVNKQFSEKVSYLLHRLLTNCPDDKVVDHINGNKLDNRKSNLRIVTQSQNCMNKQVRSNNTSGITGVSYCKRSNNWRSRICVNRKSIVLGYFNNFDDAVSARKAAEEKYFGEYSYDNSRNKTTAEINSDRVVETCEAHDHLIYA